MKEVLNIFIFSPVERDRKEYQMAKSQMIWLKIKRRLEVAVEEERHIESQVGVEETDGFVHIYFPTLTSALVNRRMIHRLGEHKSFCSYGRVSHKGSYPRRLRLELNSKSQFYGLLGGLGLRLSR